MKITYGDGVIYGASYESLESIRGLSNISIAVCDEAALSPPKLFSTLAPCLRGKDINPFIRLLSTPRRGCWLNLYCHEHPDAVEVITATTYDNKLITEDQIKIMKQSIINPDLLKQELEGVMLDIDSDASVVQLSDYPLHDSGMEAPNYMGIDLSGLGNDNNVFCIANKYRIEEIKVINKANTFELTNIAETLIDKYDVRGTFLDTTGSTSNGVLDMLVAKNRQVKGINFAQKPYVDNKYANARAEMYVETANAIKSGLYVSNEDIKTELAYTTIAINQSGKLQLCKKDDIKELIGRSPDEADAFALAVYSMNHADANINEAKHASEIGSKYLAYLGM